MKIVAMGGGTGLSSLLQGLKFYVREDWKLSRGLVECTDGTILPAISQLSAVVTVSDDGGSSGRLRRDLGVLPPGDIRNCLVALSEEEPLLARLFQFRFSSGRGLKGHSFGNLFLSALTGITGDFHEAVTVAGEVLATRGKIFPSTMSDVHLEAVLENGTVVRGETKISHSHQRIKKVRMVPSNCRPLPETLAAIKSADAITLGPGSLFTSVLPNLLVRGIAKHISASRAPKIYICNLMTQPGETTTFSAVDHVRALFDHCGDQVIDYVLVNDRPISPALRKRYLAQRSRPVEAQVEELTKLGVKVFTGDFLSEDKPLQSSIRKIRHHSGRLARAIVEISARHLHGHSGGK